MRTEGRRCLYRSWQPCWGAFEGGGIQRGLGGSIHYPDPAPRTSPAQSWGRKGSNRWKDNQGRRPDSWMAPGASEKSPEVPCLPQNPGVGLDSFYCLLSCHGVYRLWIIGFASVSTT